MNENEVTIKLFTLEREHESLIPLINESFAEAGISMHFHSKFDTAYDGIFITQKGLGDIYVFEKDREKAEKILKDILKPEQSDQ
jgi:hypothetical protein